ncbi:MAG: hypothetical protein QM669_12825 [Siphonobacter sp.]
MMEYLARPLNVHIRFGFPNHTDIHQPWGHWFENGKVMPLSPTHFYSLSELIAPAGDVSVTLANYVLFLQENLKAWKGKSKFLTSEAVEFLHRGKPMYAMGWGNALPGDQALSWHDGSAGTFYCHVIVNKELDGAVVVWTNAGDMNYVKALNQFHQKLVDHYLK